MPRRASKPSSRSTVALCLLAVAALASCKTRTYNSGAASRGGAAKSDFTDEEIAAILAKEPSLTGKKPCANAGTVIGTGDRKTTVFHWLDSSSAYGKLALKNPRAYIVGLLEQSLQRNAAGKFFETNDVGNGFYVSGDPFQSQNYGDIMVAIDVKPGRKLAYLRGTRKDLALQLETICPGVHYLFESPQRLVSTYATVFYDLSPLDMGSARALQVPLRSGDDVDWNEEAKKPAFPREDAFDFLKANTGIFSTLAELATRLSKSGLAAVEERGWEVRRLSARDLYAKVVRGAESSPLREALDSLSADKPSVAAAGCDREAGEGLRQCVAKAVVFNQVQDVNENIKWSTEQVLDVLAKAGVVGPTARAQAKSQLMALVMEAWEKGPAGKRLVEVYETMGDMYTEYKQWNMDLWPKQGQ